MTDKETLAYETVPVSYTHLDVYKRQVIDLNNGVKAD